MNVKTTKINIVDLEATCFKDRNYQRIHSEILEIGIVQVNTKTKQIEKEASYIIKPQNSYVSEFCTELTSITPEMAEKGISLQEAFELVKRDFSVDKYPWGSWGGYDARKIYNEAKTKKLHNPFSQSHYNLKELFALSKGLKKGVGLNKALNILNLEFDGTHHRGIDDAKNIAKVYNLIIK